MTIKVGQIVQWHRTVSNYGHIAIHRVVVRKIGKRITVAVPKMGGGERLAIVRPENLKTF